MGIAFKKQRVYPKYIFLYVCNTLSWKKLYNDQICFNIRNVVIRISLHILVYGFHWSTYLCSFTHKRLILAVSKIEKIFTGYFWDLRSFPMFIIPNKTTFTKYCLIQWIPKLSGIKAAPGNVYRSCGHNNTTVHKTEFSQISDMKKCHNFLHWTGILQYWTFRSQIAKFMGPTWGPPGSCRPRMGPMLAPWNDWSVSWYFPWIPMTLFYLCWSYDVVQNGWRDPHKSRSTLLREITTCQVLPPSTVINMLSHTAIYLREIWIIYSCLGFRSSGLSCSCKTDVAHLYKI